MTIIKSSKHKDSADYVRGAYDDVDPRDIDPRDFDEDVFDDDDNISDTLDDISDNIEDIQDTVDEIEPDDPNIEMDNNIEDHYIAECDRCHGIFISAVIKSDQKVDKISGTCPLCEKESDQYLKWVVEKISD